ncbi:hypothetical protein MLD38_020557 [Melastoma candidum]|uniref:Uncharacterized protein n=1 Tax=Melastoma candidum TaxID=119954 RepID=A0ACB9QCV2_9MYRT|nr:hypothetical protein MLD38_020557 [Melastoma candidum]
MDLGIDFRDLLTAFSPSLDLFAVCSGDGRIKVWDTLKDQIVTEFSDLMEDESMEMYIKPERGHLSVDYTCMKWFSVNSKKKRKLGSSLLILGTGSGDVIALDVSSGLLKWRVTDCHPGGVASVSFSSQASCVYTAGVDGMVCNLDFLTGNLLGKFRGSTKGLSAISVSSDGKWLAAASAQLKIFDCSDQKKKQKFPGHPVAVRCMVFTDDNEYVLSSAAGERYIAVWKVDGKKKQSAICTLSMEHPAIFIDSKCMNKEEEGSKGFCILAVSEVGDCYIWFGKNVDELRCAIPSKASISSQESSLKKHRGVDAVFAAKMQDVVSYESAHIILAHGLPVKPLLQKISVNSGEHITLSGTTDGILMPQGQLVSKSKGRADAANKVTALDRATADTALLPVSKVMNFNKKMIYNESGIDPDEVMNDIVKGRSAVPTDRRGNDAEVGAATVCMEDQLKSLGFLRARGHFLSKSAVVPKFDGVDLEANLTRRKMRAAVLSMGPDDAYRLLEHLIALWESRSANASVVLPWINRILIIYGQHVVSREESQSMLCSLKKMTKAREAALQPLLQLVGRLQLITAQIDKATQGETKPPHHQYQVEESETDDEENDVLNENMDYESQLSTDNEE